MAPLIDDIEHHQSSVGISTNSSSFLDFVDDLRDGFFLVIEALLFDFGDDGPVLSPLGLKNKNNKEKEKKY
tara:strand:- start:917 stop:1129 length:213 start_codon:yes stop_codon:yes gene_type:complete